MTIRNRTDLKNLTEDGDTADANLFADLIDSAINLSDTTAQSMSSDLQTPRLIATTEVSAPLARVTTVSASAVHADSGTIGGHTFAASALTLNVPSTAAGDAVPTSAGRFLRITANGSVYYLAAFTSV